MKSILQRLSILIASLFHLTKAIEVKTGDSSLYTREQYVSVGYIGIGEEANIYYQYFKNPEKNIEEKKTITFYIGHKVAESSQHFGFMGFFPYTISQNSSDPIGLTLTYNPRSLSSITDLVAVDITRGSGFSSNLIPKLVDYSTIVSDLTTFITKFFAAENIPKDTKIVIYAGYELAKVAYLYGQVSKSPIKLIIENPWLGYSSFSQLYYQLPAFGDTSRKALDMISNNIYSLQVSDYGKDLEDMYIHLSEMVDYLENNTPFNSENPVMDQSNVTKYKNGASDFFSNCRSCRAYCSLEKDTWTKNETLRNMVKRDLLFDISKTFLTDLNKVNGQTLIIQSKYTLMSSLEPVVESTSDFIPITGMGDLTGEKDREEREKNVRIGNRWQIRFLDNAGFYPFIDNQKSILGLLQEFYDGE